MSMPKFIVVRSMSIIISFTIEKKLVRRTLSFTTLH